MVKEGKNFSDLENEKEKSVVAVTGCLHKDKPENKMFITMFSNNSPVDRYFTLDINGRVQSILTKDKGNKVDNRNGNQKNEIDEVTDEVLESLASQVGDVSNLVPETLTVSLRFGVDKSARLAIEDGLDMPVDSYLTELVSHIQAHYQHHSLKHTVTFEVYHYVEVSNISSTSLA